VGIDAMLSVGMFRRGAFALGTLFFLTLFVSKRKFYVLISFLYTILSMANKTYFGIFLGLFPGLCMGDRRFHITLLFLTGIVVISFLFFGSDVIQYTLFYGKEGVGLEHTTGRYWLWTHSIELGMRRMFYGYGFAAGELELMKDQLRAIISTHNVFSSAFLSIGVTGLILFTVFFVWLIVMSIRADVPTHWKPAFLGTTIMIFVISCSSPGLGARVYGSWIPAVLTSLGMCTLAKSELLRQFDSANLPCGVEYR